MVIRNSVILPWVKTIPTLWSLINARQLFQASPVNFQQRGLPETGASIDPLPYELRKRRKAGIGPHAVPIAPRNRFRNKHRVSIRV